MAELPGGFIYFDSLKEGSLGLNFFATGYPEQQPHSGDLTKLGKALILNTSAGQFNGTCTETTPID